MDERRNDRDSDLGDDSPMSNSHADEHSDREEDDMIREDCESSDEGVNLNSNANENPLDFAKIPKHSNNNLSQNSPFGPNHPLNMFMPNLQNLQNLQHTDVLEKLKMQVGLMDPDFPLHSLAQQTTPFSIPQSAAVTNTTQSNGFPFMTPNVPSSKDANPESNSSSSSETSISSQQNNGWSFEEQFKQVRQLYEINDDPKRKEFLDDLFSFMQKRGTPINRLPIMAKSVLDLYELYNLVIARGGLVDVINKKLWQEIIKGLHLPSSITSAAFTLRTQYMKYLYPYECEKRNLSTPSELQAAIDGNRREGRRSSYGQFDSQMQGQISQLQQQMQRSPIPAGLQQMSPLSLVTHAAGPNAHHRLAGAPQLGQMANLMPMDIEQRMLEYLKMIQNNTKEPRRSQSPDALTRDARDALSHQLEMSRVALWSMYNNNTSPPTSINTTSPPNNDSQREALNLAESPPHSIKRERERDHDNASDYDHSDREFMPPSKKDPHALLHALHLQSMQNQFYNNNSRRGAVSPINNNVSGESDQHHLHQRKSHLDQRLSSPIRNGSDKSPTTSTDLMSSGSPVALLSGMQFKLSSRENSSTGETQLVVSMELNGVQYEGVLFANSVNTGQRTTPLHTSPPVTPNKLDSTLANTSGGSQLDRDRVVVPPRLLSS